MGPFIYTEPVVADTLEEWFKVSGELFVELYKPHRDMGGFFYVLNSYAQYEELMANAEPGYYSFVLRDEQLPIRGAVDDRLILEAQQQIPDGQEYIIIEPCRYPKDFSYLASGNSRAELNGDLEKLRGTEIWAGLDLDMPAEYWHENLAADALIAHKPI